MSRKFKIIGIVFLIVAFFMPAVYAETLPINIYINDKSVDFYDVIPFIDENNRTLVPVRFLSESLGGNVQWVPESREVIILKNHTKIIIKIDSNLAKVNNEIFEMDTKALIIGSRTLVPLRFISEAFDFQINYEKMKGLNNQMSHVINIYNLHLKVASELRVFNEETFDIEKYQVSLEDVSNLNDELIDYYPELYFMDRFYYDYIGQSVQSLQLEYLEETEILKNKYKKLMTKANFIIESIVTNNMSEYEKEKAIHDYIVKNTRYDEKNEWPVESHTAYGALINGIAVCDGYAESFDLLLKMVGIKSRIVYGSLDNVSHAWNLVEIDGMKYFVDVTAGDPINNTENYMSYAFFNIPFDLMQKTHDFDNDFESVVSLRDNFFYKNNLYFSSIESINNFIRNRLNNSSGEIMINLMLENELLKNQIDLEKIIEGFLLANNNTYNQNYSYIEMDTDLDYIYNVVINLNRK